MLTREDNWLLTRTGPGTPMGELWRRFWLPALLPSELPTADCPPTRIRILGENLVAFRDRNNRIAFIAENCPHRGASLFFGRNEEAGLRCVYHGWKFDVDGQCIDMPNEPAESNFKNKVRITVYPGEAWGGLIWIYMGPQQLRPQLPELPWCIVPQEHRYVDKWLQSCNFAQAQEGEIDSSHISFLHSNLDPASRNQPGPSRTSQVRASRQDGSPNLTVQETDAGFVYGSRRSAPDGTYYWRVTQFLLPNYSIIADTMGGRCWVPMDDEHCWAFGYRWNQERPMTEDELKPFREGASSFARKVPNTFNTLANAGNDYLIDREVQRTQTYTGIWGVREQDLAMVESMGPISNRTKEHLGTADIAIIESRRLLLRLARELQEGREPYTASHAECYRVQGLSVFDAAPSLATILEAHQMEMRVS